MAVLIQMRGDTAANWTSANPTLSQREMGIETDTNKIKIGDGATAWNSLGYYSSGDISRQEGSLSVATDNVEIDFNSKNEFVSTNRVAVSAAATISFANATNARFATFKVAITNLATLTFPANSISGDSRWSTLVWTPTENGNYTVSIYLTTGEYEVVISQNPAA